ncbi:hypothetical protein SAMN05444000_12247 [Shimia gijangensis]|uniref:Uncharacterized protein n=1 Tax=Shimia gijangensis TaxID=1470563 RepID=A0A1M6QMR4_9RHOB|nr:hypothetical protein SAMN05444000_12247 [Shimia gijangensis]
MGYQVAVLKTGLSEKIAVFSMKHCAATVLIANATVVATNHTTHLVLKPEAKFFGSCLAMMPRRITVMAQVTNFTVMI